MKSPPESSTNAQYKAFRIAPWGIETSSGQGRSTPTVRNAPEWLSMNTKRKLVSPVEDHWECLEVRDAGEMSI